jgi:fumarylacetoacetase
MTGGFGPDHLPYGSVRTEDGRRLPVVRLGDAVLDLTPLGLFNDGSLDPLMIGGPEIWHQVRTAVIDRVAADPELVPLDQVEPVMPFAVADYADFYANEHHAINAGRILRPGGAPLNPNWRHLPVGYHGRSASVVVSGTPVRRPSGQYRDPDGEVRFGPSQRLDFEAEVGFVVGVGNEAGIPIPVDDFADHVFGVVLLNDWSARDLQFWESAPLGPFLGKSFATSVSAWVTPLAALSAAWTAPPPRDPQPLPYLDDSARPSGLDLALEVAVNGSVVARPSFASMYWTPAQLLAHLTVNGAPTRAGDLFGSGTVSGPGRDQRGCLLELTENGAEPVRLDDGTLRRYLEDGDEVTLTATAPTATGRLTLGEVFGRIVP